VREAAGRNKKNVYNILLTVGGKAANGRKKTPGVKKREHAHAAKIPCPGECFRISIPRKKRTQTK